MRLKNSGSYSNYSSLFNVFWLFVILVRLYTKEKFQFPQQYESCSAGSFCTRMLPCQRGPFLFDHLRMNSSGYENYDESGVFLGFWM